MKTTTRTTSAAIAAVVAGGISSVFLGAAPATAATPACGATGALIAGNICEQTFTSGTSTFTPTASMTKLEVLLVGAGGTGADQPVTSSGYAAAGGGGDVKVVDFSGTTSAMTVTVSTPGTSGTVTDGTTTATVASGGDGTPGGSGTPSQGGTSGNGKTGALGIANTGNGGGGGAGAATSGPNGGAGVIVNSLVTASSLFTGDTNCYGGGGAAGVTTVTPAIQGVATCGGGAPSDATVTALTAPVANSGGGGGGIDTTQPLAVRQGADGVVVIRWNAVTVPLTFDANGHGTAPATETVPAGTAPTKPADPTAEGFAFGGWFTDSALTTPADFSAPLTAPTTFFAKWTPVLSATGVEVSPALIGLSAGALLVGATLIALARFRRRRAS